MLAGLRNAAKSKWALPIIVFLALSFAVWGVNDMFRGGPADAVATVGPERITVTEFRDELNREVQAIAAERDGRFTLQDAREAGLPRQLLSQMTTRAALDAQAGELDLGASDLAVFEDIRGTAAFEDPVRGAFSQDQYRYFLAQIGMNELQYEQSIRGDIVRRQLVSAITAGATAPDSFAQRREAFAGETRRADILALGRSLAEDAGDPDDADLLGVIESNRSAFTRPERRGVTALWLTPDDISQRIEVDEQAIADLYAFRRDSLAEPATRTFVQIPADDEAAARAAAERLDAGESAETVAGAIGAEPVMYDAATADDVVDSALADAAFSTRPGAPAAVVEGRFGWAAIQVTAATEAETPSLDELREELRAELAEETALEELYDAVALFEDSRAAGATLEEAASEAGQVAMSYLPADRRGRAADGAGFARLAAAPDVMARAFEMQTGEISELIDLSGGGFAVLRLDTVEPEALMSLDDPEVRQSAAAIWRSNRIEAELESAAEAAAEQIRGGAALAAVAEELGDGARVESVSLKRSETADAAGRALVAELFNATVGEVVIAPSAERGYAVAVLREVRVDEDAPAPGQAALAQEVAQDLLFQYQTALQSEYPVRTYADQLALASGEDVPQ